MRLVTTLALMTAIAGFCPATWADGICDHVKAAERTTKAAAATVATELGLAAAPVSAVAHSSGGLILTGASGYLANTFGFLAGAWAVATSPAPIATTAVVAVTGAGLVITCHVMDE